MKIALKNVRLSFPSLFQKAQFNGIDGKYEATFLLHKKDHAKEIAEIEAGIKAMIAKDLKGVKLGSDKLCLRDGDDVEYQGYSDHMSFKASTKKRPLVIAKDKSPLTEDDGVIYGGCYVNGSVELWAQNNEYGKRINGTLLGVQFARDGESFASGSSGSLSDFDDISDDSDDDTPF